MNLNHLDDNTVDQNLVALVRSERETLTEIPHHFREVERRRLFCNHGFGSLFDYAIKRLGYTEDEAIRRISAMRLLKELPQIEQKIESGVLKLTHLAKAQTLFRQEKKANVERTSEQKLELLLKIESGSKREVEKTIEQEARIEIPRKNRMLTLDQFSDDLQKKLKRLFDVLPQVQHEMDVHALVDKLAELGLEKWDPLKKADRARKIDAAIPVPEQVKNKRYISSAVRHAVVMRDRGLCQNCGSSHRIEIDHIVPFAKGGKNELSNLRLLCRACNQRAAIYQFGGKKMSLYFSS